MKIIDVNRDQINKAPCYDDNNSFINDEDLKPEVACLDLRIDVDCNQNAMEETGINVISPVRKIYSSIDNYHTNST